MEGDRQPYPDQFQEENQRQIGQKTDLPRISVRPADRGGVGNQDVFEKESPDRNDARQRMQPAQHKRRPLTGSQRCNPIDGSSRTG